MTTRALVLGFALVVGGATAIACGDDTGRPAAGGSSSSSSSSSGGSSGSSGGGARDAGDGGEAGDGGRGCATLAFGKPLVLATYLPGDMPDDQGGVVADGTYDLTGLEIYLGRPEQGDPDASAPVGETNSARSTMTIANGVVVQAKESTTRSVLSPLAVTEAQLRVQDLALVTDETCPETNTRSTPFTAAGATLVLHVAQTRREIYTRR